MKGASSAKTAQDAMVEVIFKDTGMQVGNRSP